MRLLLVEDNEKISELIVSSLKKHDFLTEPVFCADEALTALETSEYSMAIFDLGLPDEDGIDIIKKIRANNNPIPILILTARDSLDEKIRGLNAGADDYLTKPFATEELVARIHALLRRPSNTNNLYLSISNLVFHPINKQLEINGKTIKLSKKEAMLLEILLRSKEKIVQKENLEMQLYSYEEQGSINSVEVLLHRLRKKLKKEKANIEIHTLRGIGYMIREKEYGKISA